jgi:hypothetical protein
MIHFDAKHQKSEVKTKVKKAKIKWKNQSETKIKRKKWKKSEKIDLNFDSLCFASKQKLLNRSEAKNISEKERTKKREKKRKNAKNSEKKVKKAKKR